MVETPQIYGGEKVFEYRLLPLKGMENNNIFRINNLTDKTLQNTNEPSARTYTHLHHPFSDFPTLKSHVLPHFVVYNTASKLALVTETEDSELEAKYGSIIPDIQLIKQYWDLIKPPADSKYFVKDEDAYQFGYQVKKEPRPPRRPQKPPPDSPREVFRGYMMEMTIREYEEEFGVTWVGPRHGSEREDEDVSE